MAAILELDELRGTDGQLDAMSFLGLVKAEMDRSGDPASMVVRRLWRTKYPSPEAVDYLAVYGAVRMAVNDDVDLRSKGTSVGTKMSKSSPGKHAAEYAHVLLGSIPYVIHGKRRVLADLTAEDWEQFIAENTIKASAHRKLAAFGKDVRSELRKHNAQTIRNLPKSVAAQLESKASELW